jgi:hypothetical protein
MDCSRSRFSFLLVRHNEKSEITTASTVAASLKGSTLVVLAGALTTAVAVLLAAGICLGSEAVTHAAVAPSASAASRDEARRHVDICYENKLRSCSARSTYPSMIERRNSVVLNEYFL